MKKEEEKSYGIAAGRDLSSGVVGPCLNGAPSHDVDASYRHKGTRFPFSRTTISRFGPADGKPVGPKKSLYFHLESLSS